jgi:predicted enzyme related to lactoylglutathione lyase
MTIFFIAAYIFIIGVFMFKLKGLTIYCNDAIQTKSFYIDVLGFSFISEFKPYPDCIVFLLQKDGINIEFINRLGAPKVIHHDFTTTIEFEVDDIDSLYDNFTKSNLKIKSKLRNIGPNTKLFEIFDPDNYPICFICNPS